MGGSISRWPSFSVPLTRAAGQGLEVADGHDQRVVGTEGELVRAGVRVVVGERAARLDIPSGPGAGGAFAERRDALEVAQQGVREERLVHLVGDRHGRSGQGPVRR
ncbi:hypothetical protein [Kitasatospora sp. NPDC001527]|uniref:hypothetical protein n=1 Tax=Kitasatospora sp. NPDC001527 TaxID=3154519 RepID=UPI00331A18E9